MKINDSNILCQMSGGIDCLAALLLSIEEYGDDVGYHFFHIQLRLFSLEEEKQNNFWLVQLVSTIKQYKILKRLYPEINLKFSSPIIHVPAFIPNYDIIYQSYLTGIYTKADKYIHILRGTTKDDIDKGQGFPWEEFSNLKYIHIEDDSKYLFAKRQHLLFDDLYHKHTVFHCPAILKTKNELYDIIPEELKNYIWYCESPKRNGNIISSCNECSKCLEAKSIGINNHGIDVSEFLDIEKSHQQYLNQMHQHVGNQRFENYVLVDKGN